MSSQASIKRNDGHAIPQRGLGVWQASNDEAALAVRTALQAGYRHVDTAAIYNNEEGVGAGIRAAGVKREEIFVTTKLWNDAQGTDRSEEHTSELQSLMRISYAVFCLKKQKTWSEHNSLKIGTEQE